MNPILLILTVLFFCAGCNKPLTTPEELDPIYKELSAEAANFEKTVEEQEKKVEEYKVNFKDIVPQTGQTRKVYAEFFRLQSELDSMKQKSEYLKLAAKSRKYTARNSYIKAFEAGQTWPDPKEYENYNMNKRISSVNRDWRKRYPASSNEKPKKESGGH